MLSLVKIFKFLIYTESEVAHEPSLAEDSCLEVAYRMYWLGYHIHTYKKTQVMLEIK